MNAPYDSDIAADIRETYREVHGPEPDEVDAAIRVLRDAKAVVKDTALMASIRERLAQNKAAVADAGGKEEST